MPMMFLFQYNLHLFKITLLQPYVSALAFILAMVCSCHEEKSICMASTITRV